MSKLISPHGGEHLRPLLVPKEQRGEALARAASLKKVRLSSREVSDLFMLGMGAYTPLDGFMSYDNWKGSVIDMRLADGTFWPIPITLSLPKEVASGLGIGEEVALVDGESGERLHPVWGSARRSRWLTARAGRRWDCCWCARNTRSTAHSNANTYFVPPTRSTPASRR